MIDSQKIDSYFNGERKLDNFTQGQKVQQSRWLKFVKRGFPCIAAMLLGLMAVLPNIKKVTNFEDSLTMPKKSELEKVHIENTRYFFTDNQNKVSEITASSADELAPKTKKLKIIEPRGKISSDNGYINIESQEGLLEQDTSIITLMNNIVVTMEDGTIITTETATYDFKKSYGYGKNKISISGKWGTDVADGFEFLKNENIISLVGHNKLTSEQGTMTSEKETKIYRNENKIVAIGHVLLKKQNDTLQADEVVAYFSSNKMDEVTKVEAKGNVIVKTPKGTVSGNYGIYNPQTSIVELRDNVIIKQNGNFVKGEKAETNLRTSISRIISNNKKGGRISGTFYKKKEK